MNKSKRNIWLPILSAVCAAAVGLMIFALIKSSKTAVPTFTPPAFESAAVSGTPAVTDTSWTKVYQDGMSFSAHICGKVTLKGSAADVYFTNDSGNTVWMKLRITDESGNILAETGLLKPNEYVKSIKFDIVPNDGTNIKLKIMSYEPDTYYSAGSVTLKTTIKTDS